MSSLHTTEPLGPTDPTNGENTDVGAANLRSDSRKGLSRRFGSAATAAVSSRMEGVDTGRCSASSVMNLAFCAASGPHWGSWEVSCGAATK